MYMCFIGLSAPFGSQHSALELLSYPRSSYIFGHQQSPGYNACDWGKQFFQCLVISMWCINSSALPSDCSMVSGTILDYHLCCSY